MTIQEERQLYRLLLQREREFTAVWRAESEINKILGAAYPFPEPPLLPSSRVGNSNAKKTVKMVKGKIPKISTLIRPLERGENCYKVIYEVNGEEILGFVTDFVLIRKLLPLKTTSFSLKRVETIFLKSPEDFAVRDVLWQKGDSFIE